MTQDPVQPLCNPINVTETEIIEQENKGKFFLKTKLITKKSAPGPTRTGPGNEVVRNAGARAA